jgi:hypothetical protein
MKLTRRAAGRNAPLRNSFAFLRPRDYPACVDRLLRIGLVFDCHLAYAHGVLRGIMRYAQGKPDRALTLFDTEALKWVAFGPHRRRIAWDAGTSTSSVLFGGGISTSKV